MESITLTLIGITSLFLVLLILKSLFKGKFCAICVAISLTWISLLILYFLNIFSDKLIIAILMGMTALGIYYTVEKKVKSELTVFRLPFLLTLIFIIYSVLESFILNSIIVIAVIWIIFFLIYLSKNNKLVKKLVECCKKW
jgi:hypothetical protein